MIVESELRDEIARAVRGAPLRDLYAWLMARSWNMQKDSDTRAVELAADVESLFFGLSDGTGDESSLRHELALLLGV